MPIFTFFVNSGLENTPKIKSDLKIIAEVSGGEAEEIKISANNARHKMSEIIGKQVIENVTEDDKLRDKLKREYTEKSNNRTSFK